MMMAIMLMKKKMMMVMMTVTEEVAIPNLRGCNVGCELLFFYEWSSSRRSPYCTR